MVFTTFKRITMGLWSRGIDRSKTGEVRLGDSDVDKTLLHQVKYMLNSHLYNTIGDNEICNFKLTGSRTVTWTFNEYAFTTLLLPNPSIKHIMNVLKFRVNMYLVCHTGDIVLKLIQDELDRLTTDSYDECP